MNKYDKIINLPHYELKYHPRMPIESRAAQFAPFSALTGYYDIVSEASRLTSKEIEISEDMKVLIERKIQIIEKNIKSKPNITILYFVKDDKKTGGEYKKYTGTIKRIDNIEKIIYFSNGLKFSINNIIDINSDYIKE